MRRVVVDCHNHLSNFPNHVMGLRSFETDTELTASDLQGAWIESMKNNDVALSIVFDRDNAMAQRFIDQAPRHFAGLVVVDPRSGDAATLVAEKLKTQRFVGVKCSPSAEGSVDGHGYPLDDEQAFEFYDFCAASGIPILFHTGIIYVQNEVPNSHFVTQGDPLRLDKVAREFPELKIVVGHVGRPLWEHTLCLANHSNVFVDLTWSQLPVQLYRRSVETALRGFGSERTMFGSDSTPWMPGRSIELMELTEGLLAEIGADESEKTAVLGGTAQRLFQLDNVPSQRLISAPEAMGAHR